MDVSSSMGDENCVIQISSEINTGDASTMVAWNWVEKVKKEVSQLNQTHSIELKQWKGECIYRIPWSLKKLCRRGYQPQTVSIGPYHHGEKCLEAMEKHKQRALLNFIDRKKKPLECYVNALAQEVDDLMGAYDQLQPEWKQNTKAFLELMMVDGCFILELMQTQADAGKDDELKRMGYDPSFDPVFSRHGHLYYAPFLRRDMLMLENQIPIQVLNIILVVADGGNQESKQEDLNKRILKFFRPQKKAKGSNNRGYARGFRTHHKSKGSGVDRKLGECLHILDLYRKSQLLESYPGSSGRGSCWPKSSCFKSNKEEEEGNAYTESATKLVESGIRFAKSKTTKLNDISFECGILKLPAIEVDDSLKSEFLNMMALERFHAKTGSEVTSYVFLMDKIIDTAKDVSLLNWRHILQNSLGSDNAVANLFNSLSREACLDPDNDLYRVHKEVTKYYRNPRRRCMAYAKRKYFANPWVTVTVLAAIFIFVITPVQTIYAVLDYHHSGK